MCRTDTGRPAPPASGASRARRMPCRSPPPLPSPARPSRRPRSRPPPYPTHTSNSLKALNKCPRRTSRPPMPLKHGQRLEPPGLTRGCSSPDSAGRLQSSDSVRLHRRPLLPPPALPALRGHAPRLPTTTAPRLRASCPGPRRPWFLHLCGSRGSAAPNLPCHRGSPGFNPVRALAARRPNRPAPVAYPAFPPYSPSPLNRLRQPTPPTPPAASGSSRPGIAWPRTTPSNHHGA